MTTFCSFYILPEFIFGCDYQPFILFHGWLRGGIEVQLGKAASADSMESLKSEPTPSSSQTSTESEVLEVPETVEKLSLLPGFRVKKPKSPRGYRRFLDPKNKDLYDDDDIDDAPPRPIPRRRRAAVTEKTAHSLINTNKDSVEALIFLTKRQNEQGVATLLSAGTRGWVRAWSIHHDGGLVGQFNAAHEKGNTILAMATDPDEKYLITGDSQGYIKVWHIENYCIANEERKSSPKKSRLRTRAGGTDDKMVGTSPLGLEHIDPALERKFPFLRINQILRIKAGSQTKHDPPPESTNPSKTNKTPPLLNSFRAHLKAITAMCYIPEEEYILTGSVDKSVRCNTLVGHFVGICGQSPKWNEDAKSKSETTIKRKKTENFDDVPQYGQKVKPTSKIFSKSISSLPLPPDVRRVASTTTLKVYYGGVKPMKNLAKNLVMFWMPLLRKTQNLPKKLKSEEYQQEDDGQIGEKLLQMVRERKEGETEQSPKKEFRLPTVFPEVREGKGIFREKPKKSQQKVYLPKIPMHENQVSRCYTPLHIKTE